jgi:hypothetical protein
MWNSYDPGKHIYWTRCFASFRRLRDRNEHIRHQRTICFHWKGRVHSPLADEKCRDRKLVFISELIGSEGLQVDGLFAFSGFF